MQFLSVFASHQVMRRICEKCDLELTSHMGVELKMRWHAEYLGKKLIKLTESPTPGGVIEVINVQRWCVLHLSASL